MSCAISAALGNKADIITVEADPDVWEIHQVNYMLQVGYSFMLNLYKLVLSVQQVDSQLSQPLCLWCHG